MTHVKGKIQDKNRYYVYVYEYIIYNYTFEENTQKYLYWSFLHVWISFIFMFLTSIFLIF